MARPLYLNTSNGDQPNKYQTKPYPTHLVGYTPCVSAYTQRQVTILS